MTSMAQTVQAHMEMPRAPQLEQLQDSAVMFLSQQTASARTVRIAIAGILTQPHADKRARSMLVDLASPRPPVQSQRFKPFDYLSDPVADCMRRLPEVGIFAFTHTRLFDALSRLTEFHLEPQEEGGFVAFSNEYSGAVGQGETAEEAIRDLEEAISLLKEVLDEEETKR